MLRNPAAGLLIDMGLGKTSISLAATSILKQKGIVDKVLVIAPLRVVHGVWQQEVEKWSDFSHLRVSIVHGTQTQREKALAADADLYITNPENTVWLAGQRWKKADMLIVDECFVEGTQVETPGGSIPIEKIREGDTILSGAGVSEVLTVFEGRSSLWLKLVLSDDRSIHVTPSHHIYVQGKGWVEAQEIEVDDALVDVRDMREEGQLPPLARVVRVSRVERDRPVRVFDLEVAEGASYFAEGCLVHNSTKFKAPRTQRSLALKGLVPQFKRRYILTGTPAPNGLLDLFGQVYILDLGDRLGRFITHYRNAYFYQTGYGGYTWLPREGAEQLIYEKISDICLRMDAKDYLDMPDIMHVEQPVQLPPNAREIYNQMRKDFLAELEGGDVTAFNAAAKTSKLRQISNGSVYMDDKSVHVVHDAKIKALGDIIEQMQGNPLLVAYEFQHDRDAIVKLTGCPVLGGGTTVSQQRKIITAWNRGELPVLAVHPASAGHGLNLQAGGHHICWFGLTYNLEHFDQLLARIWRQGQREKVFVYYLLAENTLDRLVLKALRGKNHTQKKLLDALKKHFQPSRRRSTKRGRNTTAP
jgi:hypothetical protein